MDGRRAREDRDCGRAGDRVAPIRRDVGKQEDDPGGEVDDDLYVRSVNGRISDWFRGTQRRHEGRIRAGGVEKDITFVEADVDLEARIDEAYRQKYRRYAERIVDSTLTPRARSAALKLVPQA